MKKKIILPLLCFYFLSLNAQDAISNKNDLIKDKTIYLTYESGELKFFKTGEYTGREPLSKQQTFPLRGNFANIYINWLNPLKYQISWYDTSYVDPEQKAVKDFMELFIGQFTSQIISKTESEAMSARELNDITNLMMSDGKPIKKNPKSKPRKDRLYKIDDNSFNGFNDIDLLRLYIDLRKNEANIEESDIIKINTILEVMDKLDNWNSTDISTEVGNSFIKLFNIEEYSAVLDIVKSERNNLKKWEAMFKNIEDAQIQTNSLVSNLDINDPIIQLYSKQVFLSFLSKVEDNLKKNRKIIAKIKPCYDIMDKSIKNDLPNLKGYFPNRHISFSKGKVLETQIIIAEYEFNNTTKEFVKKSNVYASKIIFKRYDLAYPSVSSGVFYSDITLKGFGVSTNSEGNLLVAEDDIKKNAIVTALFLNLNFNIGSDLVAPVLQFGIDPTKKRPFMLLGGGLSVPFIKFALTGGAIWTWVPELDGLSTGDIIKSTSDLDNHIKYRFNAKPLGGYIGIQYNF